MNRIIKILLCSTILLSSNALLQAMDHGKSSSSGASSSASASDEIVCPACCKAVPQETGISTKTVFACAAGHSVVFCDSCMAGWIQTRRQAATCPYCRSSLRHGLDVALPLTRAVLEEVQAARLAPAVHAHEQAAAHIPANACTICHRPLTGETVTDNALFTCNHPSHRYHDLCMENWLLSQQLENQPVACPHCQAPLRDNAEALPRYTHEVFNLIRAGRAFAHAIPPRAVPGHTLLQAAANRSPEDAAAIAQADNECLICRGPLDGETVLSDAIFACNHPANRYHDLCLAQLLHWHYEIVGFSATCPYCKARLRHDIGPMPPLTYAALGNILPMTSENAVISAPR